ncbi:cytochrome P450 [Aquipuribacter hungaricus]|uniref:Cytochrome P450 n=1 Tax=Aquipuribacter hungaricus TaxID=545624 RepID=A0ABV7WLT2_9MICO
MTSLPGSPAATSAAVDVRPRWHYVARAAQQRVLVRALARTGDPVARWAEARPGDDHVATMERVRARGRLVPSRVGVLAVTAHADCAAVLGDPRFGVRRADGSSPRAAPLDDAAFAPLDWSLLDLDPPDHSRLRRLVAPAFRPSLMRPFRARVEVLCDGLADRLAARLDAEGTADLMALFAAPLPIGVVSELLGVPDADAEQFDRIGATVGRALDGVVSGAQAREVSAAAHELATLFARLLEVRRAEPADDVLSALAAAVDDDRAGAREAVSLAALLLVAGFETALNLIGNSVASVLAVPGAWQALAGADDDVLADAVVQESLRAEPPVQATMRVSHEPVDLGGGAVVPAGRPVLVMVAAANRDPAVFADPHRFDPGRTDGAAHLAFSGGVHYCVGAPLARLEGAVALRTLARRLPGLALAGGVVRRDGVTIRGYARLPVRLR